MKKSYFREQANFTANSSNTIVALGKKAKEKFVLENFVPSKARINHKNCRAHIHDLEYYDTTYNCIGVDVKTVVGKGTMTIGKVFSRLFRGIINICNNQSGGIGFLDFDGDMANYICDSDSDETIRELIFELFLNINTPVRKGSESAYVTFNIGLETSRQGRRFSYLLLDVYAKGDENGKPFTFPNIVFKIKSDVNMEEWSPNHDIFRKALSVTAKRMVPTYFNCDAPYNALANCRKIGIMGCRTRVVNNLYGESSGLNRGNICCATMNLVQLATESGGCLEKFHHKIIRLMIETKECLLHRMHTLCQGTVVQPTWYKDYNLGMENMFRNGTLSIGFIGLWDAISVLYHETFSDIKQMRRYHQEAIDTVRLMREVVDAFTTKTGFNFSLLASAAEGATGRFAKHDASVFTDEFERHIALKGYYSNSFHVPVDVSSRSFDKIMFEAPLHALCNGGNITYVEFSESPNETAIAEVIRFAHEKDINYLGINFPLDYCSSCGYAGRLSIVCPRCSSSDIVRLRRVSGYLSATDKFTEGKRFELSNRVSHDI